MTAQIKDLNHFDGKEATLQGWLYGKRSGGKVVFLLVRDGTGVCQCVVEARQPELFQAASDLGQESSLTVTGTIRADARSPGGFEMAVSRLQVHQPVRDYPI